MAEALCQDDAANSLSYPDYLQQLAQFDADWRNANYPAWRERSTSLSYPAFLATR